MRGRHRTLLLLAALLSSPASALDFRSISTDRAVLYDSPSVLGKKLFLASRYYPVEVIVDLPNFAKVRDIAGDLAWVEKKNLNEKRTVLVNVPVADILKSPEENAPPVFQAERGVVLELLESTTTGWIKVRHADGAVGFVRVAQVWGI